MEKNLNKSNESIQQSNESIQQSNESIQQSNESIQQSNDRFTKNSKTSFEKTRKYVTLPGGKRKWVRLVPPKKRGQDLGPRKKGSEHGNWKHGFGKSRPYDTKKYSAWKEAVLRNGKFRCFVTGETSSLVCHHLDSWNWCVEGRYLASNGVVLSNSIHNKFHSIYGHGKNTRQQFEEFLIKNYNMTLSQGQYGNHEPSFTTESTLKDLEKKTNNKQTELNLLMETRNHELVSGVYENSTSKIVVKCNIHNVVHETTVTNYKKSRTGMPCCGRERQSKATSYHNTRR